MNTRSFNILLIFVKYPEPGRVKTRLAKDIGKESAAQIYLGMTETIIRNLSESERYKTAVFFDPPERKREFESWLQRRVDNLFPQEGESLGERMSNAFTKVFSLGAEKAIVIGTDCVEVSEETISQALYALEAMDLVLGPAEDGGYYLLGLKKPEPDIFHDISWSTELVLDQTLRKAEEKGLKFQLLKTLRDVDTVSDLREDLIRRIKK
jgi:rSAM/selenodomain-associated transferase 1